MVGNSRDLILSVQINSWYVASQILVENFFPVKLICIIVSK